MPARVETGPSFMAPARRQREILAVLHDGEIERARVLHRPAHQLGVHHRLAVVGDGHAAGLLELPHLGQLLAAEPLGDGADRVDAHHARLRARGWMMSSVTARLSLGGVVFGIAQTAVNPPAAAARVPVAMSSLYSCPGSRRWVCRSMSPGMTHCPRTSIDPNVRADTGGDPGTDRGDDAVLQKNVRLGVKTRAEDRGPGRRADRDPFAGSS